MNNNDLEPEQAKIMMKSFIDGITMNDEVEYAVVFKKYPNGKIYEKSITIDITKDVFDGLEE